MWAKSAESTLKDLGRPSTLTFICGERVASLELLYKLGEVLAIDPVSITQAALGLDPVCRSSQLADRLEGKTLLYDIEAICWSPWLRLNVVRFLRDYSRRRGVVAIWPGTISGGTLTFSAAGRRDHVSAQAGGLGVLRPLLTTFPDQVPFSFERIPA